jgi:hypothetical protein
MVWEERVLESLQQLDSGSDENQAWRVVLDLYAGITSADAAELDLTILKMIDQDYRNAYSRDPVDSPFEALKATLPSGMKPDDLLCVEAAVLTAAARGLGSALFSFNRLLRAPRWHAIYPHLRWLNEGTRGAQTMLAATTAGRYVGALLGFAVGDALDATAQVQNSPSSLPLGEKTARMLTVAEAILKAPLDPVSLLSRQVNAWTDSEIHIRTLPATLGYRRRIDQVLAIAQIAPSQSDLNTDVSAFHLLMQGLLQGRSKESACTEAGFHDAAVSGKELDPNRLWAPLKVATGSLVQNRSFEQTITQAAAYGGYVSALAGSMAGAVYGPLAIPRKWSTLLVDRERLETIAHALYDLAGPTR